MIPVLAMAKRTAVDCMTVVVADIIFLPLAFDVLILLHLGDTLGMSTSSLGHDSCILLLIPLNIASSILILTLAMDALHIEITAIETICQVIDVV